ncbi:EAL domain-containing protein [Reinekea blandensis]|uniref:Uncharacterized protein n=1 Tax=Reinekea blandensis MED297 TaxID=314283 RepID=A4BE50_9GAMM|nr:EAL domain-containing protein [Reinekea blandensis]EAR09528.1 hypothetical protein MED297_12392 [Reinekea blandensis MED297]
MSPSSSSAIRILLIHDTQNEAEPIANALRNAGQAVRSHFIASLDELAKVIDEQTWDIMLVRLNTSTVDATEAVETVQREGKDIPMIGLIDQYDEDIISSALDMGIADVIVESSEQHLVQAVRREVASLRSRRELRTQRIALKETEKRCQLLLESSVDAIAYVHEGMHIYANPIYMDMFGYDDIEELQCTPIMDLVSGEEVSHLKDALKGFKEGKSGELTTKGQTTDGETFGIHMDFSSASYEGEPCTQIIIRKNDVNEAVLQEKIREISSQDLVTGLHNKLYFNEQLDKAYQRVINDSTRMLVLHLGLTNFNEVKSAVGVAGSDVILKDLAEQLQIHQPDNSILARYADDMFALLLPSSDLEAAKKVINHTIQSVQEHLFDVDGTTVPVKLACGIAHIDEACKNGNEALVQADQAFSQALQSGERLAYFDKSDIANLADNSLLAKVDHALMHDGLRVQFQPIMSLRGDSQEHYDILVRLIDKDGSDILADDFIPAIENSELSGKLDRWVVQQCIEALAEHRRRGHNTQLLIHLTAASIQDPTFLPWVNSLLKAEKLPGDSICFQITEQIAHSHLKAAKAFSKGLSLLKCQLSINQFGVGDNGLALTRHLDINYARIDGSFVEQLVKDGQASDELTALLKAIHQNDINSIVPKIEHAEVLASLWELGVNYIQGYYLQAPLDDMDYNFEADEEEAV